MSIKWASAITLLAGAALASAGVFTVEPDDYPVGTDISNPIPGVTLSTVRSDLGNPQVLAVAPDESYWASTGDLVFGHAGAYDEHWVMNTVSPFRYGALRVDFDLPATYVALDIIGNDPPDIGMIEAYDSSGTLLTTLETALLLAGEVEELALSGIGDISYVIAGGKLADTICLDNLRYIPEPGSGMLCLCLLAVSSQRRRRLHAN